MRQLEEEAGSAGEQPASNKAGTYTVVRQLAIAAFPLLPVSQMAQKTHISIFIQFITPF
jgi:hypothetical protein